MTYNYICPNCKMQVTINKSMQDSNRVEYCALCEHELKRVYQVPMIKTNDGVKQ